MRKEPLAAYSNALFEQTFSRELSKTLSWSVPMENPTAILLAGQPGGRENTIIGIFFQTKPKYFYFDKWGRLSKISSELSCNI